MIAAQPVPKNHHFFGKSLGDREVGVASHCRTGLPVNRCTFLRSIHGVLSRAVTLPLCRQLRTDDLADQSMPL